MNNKNNKPIQKLNSFSTSILNAKNSNNETSYYNIGILLVSTCTNYKKHKEKRNENKVLSLKRK